MRTVDWKLFVRDRMICFAIDRAKNNTTVKPINLSFSLNFKLGQEKSRIPKFKFMGQQKNINCKFAPSSIYNWLSIAKS